MVNTSPQLWFGCLLFNNSELSLKLQCDNEYFLELEIVMNRKLEIEMFCNNVNVCHFWSILFVLVE